MRLARRRAKTQKRGSVAGAPHSHRHGFVPVGNGHAAWGLNAVFAGGTAAGAGAAGAFFAAAFLAAFFAGAFFAAAFFAGAFFARSLLRRSLLRRGLSSPQPSSPGLLRRSLLRRGFLRRSLLRRGLLRQQPSSPGPSSPQPSSPQPSSPAAFFAAAFFAGAFFAGAFFAAAFFAVAITVLLDQVEKRRRHNARGTLHRSHSSSESCSGGTLRSDESMANREPLLRQTFHGSQILISRTDLSDPALRDFSPRTTLHPTGTRSRGSRRSCAPSSGRSFRSSRGTGSPRWRTVPPDRSASRGGSRCSACNP